MNLLCKFYTIHKTLLLSLVYLEADMYVSEIIKALHSMQVETGSLVCLGCSHENNCSTHGCAIMRAAADKLAQTTHALNQALCERNNFRGAYLEITDMLAQLHRGELPPIPEDCPSDSMTSSAGDE
jgi:hypothetical protein